MNFLDKRRKTLFILVVLVALLYFSAATTTGAVCKDTNGTVIVCTTNVLGSIVKQYVGNQTEVVVLAQPGLCPADYDMKPSDIEAVSRARVLFYLSLIHI